MSFPIYETAHNILLEAGFISDVRDERATYANGVVKTAFANYVSKTSDSAIATKDDVAVYINGTPATVQGVNAALGAITIAETATESDIVTVDYHYSPTALDFVSTVRDDATCAVLTKMKGVDPCAPYKEDDVPYCVRMIVRLWAAGLLLAKDYGYNTDVELTSKDGYKKIEEAKALLEDFYKSGGACGGTSSGVIDNQGGSGDILARSDGDLFGCPHRGRNLCCSDAYFERETEC